MFDELRHLLSRVAVHDLKNYLGKEIVGLADYLNESDSASKLVNAAISTDGKKLLERKTIRWLLIFTHLKKEEIESLGAIFECSF